MVFGSTGFVGRHVVAGLNVEGVRHVGISAPRTQGDLPNHDVDVALSRYESAVLELAEKMRGCRAVVIASGTPEPTSTHRAELLNANALSPAIIARAAARAEVHRCIYISSAAVQGDADQLDASSDCRPLTPYAISKVAGEEAVLRHGPPGSVVYRPPGVHGVDRAVTVTLARLARSPLAAVEAPGTQPTPLTLVTNVASAVVFLATVRATPPPIVSHPWEGVCVSSVLNDLGGKRPRHLRPILTRPTLRALTSLGRFYPRISPFSRRAEVLLRGQSQASSWLTQAGWSPPEGRDAWRGIGDELRKPKDADATVLFGVTSGLSAPGFFEGQFEFLAQRGWSVSLVTTDEGGAKTLADHEGASFITVQTQRKPDVVSDLRTLAFLILLLHRRSPSVAVWGSPKLGLLGTLASRITATPSVYVVHGLRFETATGLQRASLMALEGLACRSAVEVVCVGREVRQHLVKAKLVSAQRTRVIHHGSANGVPEPATSLRTAPRQGGCHFGFVGRVTVDKGISELLDAWKVVLQAHPTAKLTIAGRREQDALGEKLARQIDDARSVSFVGHCADVEALYESIDVLVLPSYREGLPTVVLEAAVRGIPSIVTNATGVSEPVLNHETGFVIPAQDSGSLAVAMATFASDPLLVRQFGRSAAEYIRARYDQGELWIAWNSYLQTFSDAPSDSRQAYSQLLRTKFGHLRQPGLR